MINIEVDGIPCSFNDESLDDFEMLERLERLQSGDAVALVAFARGIFGDEQMDNIKSQLRGDNGVCRVSDMTEFVVASINAAAEAKRSDAKN